MTGKELDYCEQLKALEAMTKSIQRLTMTFKEFSFYMDFLNSSIKRFSEALEDAEKLASKIAETGKLHS